MNKVEIVRPEGIPDNADLHQVVCGFCGHIGEPSFDRHALVVERSQHGPGLCVKSARKGRNGRRKLVRKSPRLKARR